jgi:molecular chaperone GrpE
MSKEKDMIEDVVENVIDDSDVEETTEVVEPEIIEETASEVDEEPIDELTRLKEEVKQLKNDLLKEKADMENVRKRLEKERINERKYQGMSIIKDLLKPIHHFDLALNAKIENEAVKNFQKGYEMIYKEIMTVFEQAGVSEIDALGEPYNPTIHHAIQVEKVDGIDSEMVVEVLQKGYMFKDRVIVPAMVKVSE